MLDSDFFVPEIDFAPSVSQARGEVATRRLLFRLVAWSFAAATCVAVQGAGASAARVVPEVLVRSHPSPELTPEVIGLYREAGSEDLELAELGMGDYRVLVGDAEGT